MQRYTVVDIDSKARDKFTIGVWRKGLHGLEKALRKEIVWVKLCKLVTCEMRFEISINRIEIVACSVEFGLGGVLRWCGLVVKYHGESASVCTAVVVLEDYPSSTTDHCTSYWGLNSHCNYNNSTMILN